jgi:SAM-dependent methyltransferase
MKNVAEFDQFADSYDDDLSQALSVSGESKEFFARGRIAWLARRLKPFCQPARSLVDYGCGVGDTTALVRELLGCETIIGLDVSVRSLERARRNHGSSTDFFLTFDEYIPDASLDVAYCNGVFHHIPLDQRMAAVDYIYRCLRPGGMFALWENNPWNPGAQYVMHRCCFDRNAIKISAPVASRLLAEGGFEVVCTDYLFFFPRYLRALRSLEPFLVKVPLGAQYLVLARKAAKIDVVPTA